MVNLFHYQFLVAQRTFSFEIHPAIVAFHIDPRLLFTWFSSLYHWKKNRFFPSSDGMPLAALTPVLNDLLHKSGTSNSQSDHPIHPSTSSMNLSNDASDYHSRTQINSTTTHFHNIRSTLSPNDTVSNHLVPLFEHECYTTIHMILLSSVCDGQCVYVDSRTQRHWTATRQDDDGIHCFLFFIVSSFFFFFSSFFLLHWLHRTLSSVLHVIEYWQKIEKIWETAATLSCLYSLTLKVLRKERNPNLVFFLSSWKTSRTFTSETNATSIEIRRRSFNDLL